MPKFSAEKWERQLSFNTKRASISETRFICEIFVRDIV